MPYCNVVGMSMIAKASKVSRRHWHDFSLLFVVFGVCGFLLAKKKYVTARCFQKLYQTMTAYKYSVKISAWFLLCSPCFYQNWDSDQEQDLTNLYRTTSSMCIPYPVSCTPESFIMPPVDKVHIYLAVSVREIFIPRHLFYQPLEKK